MLSENFLMSESISELGNFYGVASVDMSPDQIWNTGSVWLVWCQTHQMDGVLLMMKTPLISRETVSADGMRYSGLPVFIRVRNP